jgi:hypothetical protein
MKILILYNRQKNNHRHFKPEFKIHKTFTTAKLTSSYLKVIKTLHFITKIMIGLIQLRYLTVVIQHRKKKEKKANLIRGKKVSALNATFFELKSFLYTLRII